MGQKVNPVGLRLGVNRTWDSRWFANKGEYGQLLHEDMEIRKALMEELKQAAVSKIVIERPHKKCRVTIHSARPGIVIGKKGADIEKLRKKVARLTDSEVHINIVEVRKPEIDATLVAQSIAQQLERRVAFRPHQAIVEILDVFLQVSGPFLEIIGFGRSRVGLGGSFAGLGLECLDLLQQRTHLHLKPLHLLHQFVRREFLGVGPGGRRGG